ncbi:MAG: polyprenol monophosphomannose synthase [Deltaproteobacteria bacterium]|nr:polyprenol monophosphomannose synthase [Deltaproteobacteria bacterium]
MTSKSVKSEAKDSKTTPPTADAVICLPTYNERENLPSIIKEVLRTAPTIDILVIDDNSPDGTGAVADGICAKEPRVHVLHRAGKEGLGKAYIAGFKWALERSYRFIFEMDADFSHQPRYIPQFLRAIEDYDLVLGSRYVEGGGTENWNALRKLISKGGSLYARSILQVPFKDLTGGFKCFRREVLEAIDLDAIECTGYAFQIELTFRAHQLGFRVKEIPIIFYERIAGHSKMGKNIVLEAVHKVWSIKFN